MRRREPSRNNDPPPDYGAENLHCTLCLHYGGQFSSDLRHWEGVVLTKFDYVEKSKLDILWVVGFAHLTIGCSSYTLLHSRFKNARKFFLIRRESQLVVIVEDHLRNSSEVHIYIIEGEGVDVPEEDEDEDVGEDVDEDVEEGDAFSVGIGGDDLEGEAESGVGAESGAGAVAGAESGAVTDGVAGEKSRAGAIAGVGAESGVGELIAKSCSPIEEEPHVPNTGNKGKQKAQMEHEQRSPSKVMLRVPPSFVREEQPPIHQFQPPRKKIGPIVKVRGTKFLMLSNDRTL